MAILSDRDIKKELGKNIYLSPFHSANLKGGSINLTASKYGWSLETKKSIYDPQQKALVIPPNGTALIETEEAIYVSQHIGGSYHSKVTLVSKGISHISTTLDPGWVGSSLIALHNNSSSEVQIPVGSSFVTIIFHYLKSKSSHGNADPPGRIDILTDFNLTDAERDWLDDDWRKYKNKLKLKMESDEDYKSMKKTTFVTVKRGIVINISIFIICLASFFFLKEKMTVWGMEVKDYLIPILVIYLGATSTQIAQSLK